MFIQLIMKFHQSNNKIGFSSSYNFWKYLNDILERGSLGMMFHNNIFSNLILKSLIDFDPSLQELLYNNFVKIFKTLYNREERKTKEIFDQIAFVILEIIDKTNNTSIEHITTTFLIQISDILVCNETPLNETKKSEFTCWDFW